MSTNFPIASTHCIRIILLVGILFASCKNDQVCDVPSYPVHLDMDIVSEYPEFVTDNGYQVKTFTSKRYENDYIGYAGLLVWVDMQSQYRACDLCCPYCIQKDHPIEVNGILATCPLCGEQYDLSYGIANPTQGISKQGLRRYAVSFNGRILSIRN